MIDGFEKYNENVLFISNYLKENGISDNGIIVIICNLVLKTEDIKLTLTILLDILNFVFNDNYSKSNDKEKINNIDQDDEDQDDEDQDDEDLSSESLTAMRIYLKKIRGG